MTIWQTGKFCYHLLKKPTFNKGDFGLYFDCKYFQDLSKFKIKKGNFDLWMFSLISRKSGACNCKGGWAERRKPGLSSSYYWIRNVGNSRWGSNFVCLPPGIDLSLSWNEYGRKKKEPVNTSKPKSQCRISTEKI